MSLPEGSSRVRILGVDYVHVKTRDDGDLYVTQFGLPYLEHLKLKNWLEEEWFHSHREKLKGTSTIYKVRSREVNGRHVDFVVKWSRVGEEVPLDTFTFAKFADVEFNSPYEEFSLLFELRTRKKSRPMMTNRPLAIYVPREELKQWQTGRSKSRIDRKKAKYRDVELDLYRQYILVYEWVKGVSADEALEQVIEDDASCKKELARLTERSKNDMEQRGFCVADHKPAHVILRPGANGAFLKDRTGDHAYALVDFELLMRTPEHERQVESTRRRQYLSQQKQRFVESGDKAFPEHLKRQQIFGVDYVWGCTESTNGMVWVVGRDPDLFDYFQPERWRHTPRERLSRSNETYYTVSKDHINLVWKISRVGETPELNLTGKEAEVIIAQGYNSPFEEFSVALELGAKGFSTIYPRAVYRAGIESSRAQEYVVDDSRFVSHRSLQAPDGRALLSREHNYLTIWGYWRCLDEWPGMPRQPACVGVNLLHAVKEELISERRMRQLLGQLHRRLSQAGFIANLKPSHFLLSKRPDGSLRMDEDGEPMVTISNFELIKRKT